MCTQAPHAHAQHATTHHTRTAREHTSHTNKHRTYTQQKHRTRKRPRIRIHIRPRHTHHAAHTRARTCTPHIHHTHIHATHTQAQHAYKKRAHIHPTHTQHTRNTHAHVHGHAPCKRTMMQTHHAAHSTRKHKPATRIYTPQGLHVHIHARAHTHAITRTYTRMHHVHTHAVIRNTHRTNTCLNVKCILGLSACFKYLVWCMAYKDSEPEFTVSSDPHIGTGSGNLLITSHTIQTGTSKRTNQRTHQHTGALCRTEQHAATPSSTYNHSNGTTQLRTWPASAFRTTVEHERRALAGLARQGKSPSVRTA
jgi:hypothetical protein